MRLPKYYLYAIDTVYADQIFGFSKFWVITDKPVPKIPKMLWTKNGDARKSPHWADESDAIKAWKIVMDDSRATKTLEKTLTYEELVVELL